MLIPFAAFLNCYFPWNWWKPLNSNNTSPIELVGRKPWFRPTLYTGKIIALISFVVIFSYTALDLFSNKVTVKVINSTTNILKNVKVDLCESSLDIGNVKPGETKTDYTLHSCEDTLVLTIANPRYRSKKSCCYVTTGMDITYVFNVKKDDVQIYSEI